MAVNGKGSVRFCQAHRKNLALGGVAKRRRVYDEEEIQEKMKKNKSRDVKIYNCERK